MRKLIRYIVACYREYKTGIRVWKEFEKQLKKIKEEEIEKDKLIEALFELNRTLMEQIRYTRRCSARKIFLEIY